MNSLPKKHPDEEKRLQVLHGYDILDTATEEDFDALTELIAYICDTPMALVSLVDRDRQWFKSHYGLTVQTSPLETSFCGHTILETELMVIPDTLEDPRFQYNPFVVGDPYLRFYAGALLKSEEGLPLGTLCVLDRKPRQLDERQIGILMAMARQTMALITLRRDTRTAQLAQAKLQRAMEESHHRIKNNLQVLASLVELQRFKHTDLVPHGELQRLAEHIQTLGTLHDLLTGDRESAAVGHLQAAALLDRVMPLLETASGGRKLEFHAPDSLELSVRQASSFLPLLAELIGNAIKHGEGTVTVTLSEVPEGIRLTVTDEGKGFPEGFSANQAANTGLDLIESMARWDLGGEVRYENTEEGGARVSVTFPGR
ncbi:MAG: histidine kinase dimerization/phosphoacceptor domain -containing protein [Armatimonas sp.]